VTEIHGGPHTHYGWSPVLEFQILAAAGMGVFYSNPRGSDGYGRAFNEANLRDWGHGPMRDVLAGVDALVADGLADPERLGVTGGSGGGILTNWAITQTDRFKAAVSQRSIADWSAFWYTADFALFQPTWFRAAPWQDPQDFAARSPITHAEKIKTPLMLIEGEADYRTPPTAGGEQMFRALKLLRKPVVMVRFPEESHDLSRSGHPRRRTSRLQHIVGWFDRYLMGKDVAYDVD
jgi:dipeptidyl aminopeptidase/acylaminoacyl peptidase